MTIYVDGAPILRNVLNVTGIQHDDAQPWILGAGMWGEETCMVTEPLEESQWLTPSADETPGTDDDATDEQTVGPTDDPTPIPNEDPAVVEKEPTEPTTEPSKSPSDVLAADEDTNNDDDLARTDADVHWLIAAGAVAIALGALPFFYRPRLLQFLRSDCYALTRFVPRSIPTTCTRRKRHTAICIPHSKIRTPFDYWEASTPQATDRHLAFSLS